jgi:hypothetical protein
MFLGLEDCMIRGKLSGEKLKMSKVLMLFLPMVQTWPFSAGSFSHVLEMYAAIPSERLKRYYPNESHLQHVPAAVSLCLWVHPTMPSKKLYSGGY